MKVIDFTIYAVVPDEVLDTTVDDLYDAVTSVLCDKNCGEDSPCRYDWTMGGTTRPATTEELIVDTSACPCCGQYPCVEPCKSNNFKCCPRCY